MATSAGSIGRRYRYYTHRLRYRLWARHFARVGEALLHTPPLACDPAASCHIHTMLGHRDIRMYLLAAKSFLRFYGRVGIVVHPDGTVTGDDVRLLLTHLPGCRVIGYRQADADASARLGAHSFLAKCRAIDVNFRRLVDTELFCTSPKRIIMDSDVVTLRKPVEVINWIEQGTKPFLIGATPPPLDPSTVDSATAHVQTIFEVKLDELSAALDMTRAFQRGTTAGFYGCGSEFDLDLVARIIEACMALHIPLSQWGGDQCIVIYLLSLAGATRLSETFYFNFWPDDMARVDGAHVVHFLGNNRFYERIYARKAIQIARSLGEPLHE